MEAVAGTSLEVPIQIMQAQTHIDPDGSAFDSVVLRSHPSHVPTITRDGTGRYRATWTGLDPALTAGTTEYVDIDGKISAVAWTTYTIAVQIESAIQVSSGATLDEIAGAPKRTQAGSEMSEEHSLADQVKYDAHKAAQTGRTATPTDQKTGLPIFRGGRLIHGRP